MLKIGNKKIFSIDHSKVISKISTLVGAEFNGRMFIFCELYGRRVYVNFVFIDSRKIIEEKISYFLIKDKKDNIIYAGRKLDNFSFLDSATNVVYKFEFYDKYSNWLFSRIVRVFGVYDKDNICNYILNGVFIYNVDNNNFVFKFIDDNRIENIKIIYSQFNTYDIMYNDTFNINFYTMAVIVPDRNSEVYQNIIKDGYSLNYKYNSDFVLFGASATMNDGRSTRISSLALFNIYE